MRYITALNVTRMTSRYSKFNLFAYSWSNEDEDTRQNGLQNIIKIYGWNEKNESVYVRVEDFPIPLYVDLPMDVDWTEDSIQSLCTKLRTLNPRRGFAPTDLIYEKKHRSYYAYMKPSTKKDSKYKYERKKFPFILALFSSSKASEYFSSALRKDINVPGVGRIRLKCHASERSITPVLKFLGIKKLPSAGWMTGKGIRLTKIDKESTRKHEYAISHNDIKAISEKDALNMPIVMPRVMSFDNEANSTITSSMPKAHRPGDKTFQIGYTILEPAKNGKPKEYKKFLLSLGNPNDIEGVTVKRCKTEADLYLQLTTDIVQHDPEVILGYNILGWDINYMIDRCKLICKCMSEFDMMGCIEGRHAPEEPISWTSSAYGKQEFRFLNADGRLFIDMLPYVKRNYKLANYRLETVCDEFLKVNKDPLKPKDIFRLYRQFTPEALTTIGTYCVQDSYVCLLLYEKLMTWFDLTESASTNNVPMFDMFTKGQQIKMYSQVYAYCFHNNIVIESNAYQAKEDEHYTGAYVSEPIRGLYDSIIPFDFASLYPSIMRAYNIDYSTMVEDDSIPDEDCSVMEWEEHSYCSHDKAHEGKRPPKMKDGTEKKQCASYKYRWLKHSVAGKGIIPTLLENLLGARKNTRKLMAVNKKEVIIAGKAIEGETFTEDNRGDWEVRIKAYKTESEVPAMKILIEKCTENGSLKSPPYNLTDSERAVLSDRITSLESINQVLERRQLAYKVNANSMYGAMGAKKGYAPFLPAAMCVTYMGRTNILKVNKFVEDTYGATVVYNDTDSAYCYFPEFKDKSPEELWNFSEQVVKDIKHLFPPEVILEFEEKIYKKFLILSKKRYAAIAMNKEGKIESKLIKRGIILQRRDNCRILREIYQALIFKVFEHHKHLVELKNAEKHILVRDPVVRELLDMIVSAVDSVFRWSYVPNEEGVRTPYPIRDFVVTKAMTREPSEYKNPSRLPSHVHLAQKMQRRGMPVGAGSRIEYVVCKDVNKSYKKSETQKERITDIEYFLEFRQYLRLCHLTYLKTFINPIDDVCTVAIGVNDFVKDQWNTRIKFASVVDRIRALGEPNILFDE